MREREGEKERKRASAGHNSCRLIAMQMPKAKETAQKRKTRRRQRVKSAQILLLMLPRLLLLPLLLLLLLTSCCHLYSWNFLIKILAAPPSGKRQATSTTNGTTSHAPQLCAPWARWPSSVSYVPVCVCVSVCVWPQP